MNAAAQATPLVSFALPVRNGATTISQSIESIRSQTLEDWELVISDNLSSDGTSEICAAYASEDERIRHLPTSRDLSQNANFVEAFRHTRGTFFRWHGDDDWLEPTYAERTVEAIRAVPEAVLCTTLQHYYDGETRLPLNDRLNALGGVSAGDPAKRLVQFLHVYEKAHWFGIDPVYSLARRNAVARTDVMPPYRFADFIFACEMSLLGRFTHVPHVLAHRRVAEPLPHAEALERVANRTSWTRYAQREVSLLRVWRAAERSGAAHRSLVGPLVGYALREHAHGVRRRLQRLARQ